MDNNQPNGWEMPDDAALPPLADLKKTQDKVKKTVSLGQFVGSMLHTFLGSVEATLEGMLESDSNNGKAPQKSTNSTPPSE
jgi:hypothetical protein